jgi:ferredoxin
MHDTLAAASASLRWSRPENMMASMLMDAIAFSSTMRRPLREQRIRRDDGKRDVFRCSAWLWHSRTAVENLRQRFRIARKAESRHNDVEIGGDLGNSGNRSCQESLTSTKLRSKTSPEGQKLLDVSIRHRIPHLHQCGGYGRCTTCRVQILDGLSNVSPLGGVEQKVFF